MLKCLGPLVPLALAFTTEAGIKLFDGDRAPILVSGVVLEVTGPADRSKIRSEGGVAMITLKVEKVQRGKLKPGIIRVHARVFAAPDAYTFSDLEQVQKLKGKQVRVFLQPVSGKAGPASKPPVFDLFEQDYRSVEETASKESAGTKR
jgi:hypothetical protein